MNFLKKTNGSYLILSAVIIPVIILFWGWVLNSAWLLNQEMHQQISLDAATLSAAKLSENYQDSEKKKNPQEALLERAKIILATFNQTFAEEPKISTKDLSTTVEVISTEKAYNIFTVTDFSITKKSSATAFCEMADFPNTEHYSKAITSCNEDCGQILVLNYRACMQNCLNLNKNQKKNQGKNLLKVCSITSLTQ
jgi:hypothetical protein